MARTKPGNNDSSEKKRTESIRSESISGEENRPTNQGGGAEKPPVKTPQEVIKKLIEEYKTRSKIRASFEITDTLHLIDIVKELLRIMNRKEDKSLKKKEIEENENLSGHALRDGIEALRDLTKLLIEIIHVGINTSDEAEKVYLFGEEPFDAYIYLWFRK